MAAKSSTSQALTNQGSVAPGAAPSNTGAGASNVSVAQGGQSTMSVGQSQSVQPSKSVQPSQSVQTSKSVQQSHSIQPSAVNDNGSVVDFIEEWKEEESEEQKQHLEPRVYAQDNVSPGAATPKKQKGGCCIIL